MQDFTYITNNIETIKAMASKGDADAQNKIGCCFRWGIAGFAQKHEEAVRWFKKAADQGLAKSQSNLGVCYLNGTGVEQDSKTAVEWFSKAAEQGYAFAQIKLARCLIDGEGVETNHEKAVEWFNKAAEQGLSDAQLDLGYCYEQGLGVTKDVEKAAEYYKKAAQQGNPIAQTNLAYFYEKGIGVEKCIEKAIEWYNQAAAQENARALNNLGFLYENGNGVEKNTKKAFALYSKSAEFGFIDAINNVAFCYENGIGTSQSFVKADFYYSQIAKEGNEYAKKAKERIKEKVEKEKFYRSIKFTTRQKIGSESYARVIPFGKNYIVKGKDLWGIVDKKNNQLLPIDYDSVHWFDGGYAAIQKGKLWGMVDDKGNVTIEPQYVMLQYFSDHKACKVENGDDVFLVDVYNNVIMKATGKTIRYEGEKIMVCSKDEWQLFNVDGTPFSNVHDCILHTGDYYEAFDGQEKTLIKRDGSEVKLPPYEVSVFVDGLAAFRFHDKYGIIDDNGNIVVPNEYAYINLGSGVIAINDGNKTTDNDRYFYAMPREGKWTFRDYTFKEITPYQYDDAGSAYDKDGKVWFGKRQGCWYQITSEGESLFAKGDKAYQKKKESIENKRDEESEWGKFDILEDERFKKEGRKLFVRSCDGFYIKQFYLTPYIPSSADMKWHYKIGEYFVNKYGQSMFNPHAFKMPKQKKPRHVFKLNPTLMNLSEKELTGLFARLLSSSGLEEREIIDLYAFYQTHRKMAILCDWLLRKYKRNKNTKFSFDDIVSLITPIENWDKKRR